MKVAKSDRYLTSIQSAPKAWGDKCVSTESSLHQLSPFIGKLKSTIARDLILRYSKAGDLILDPFSGSGTVALESLLNNRSSIASDLSPYSRILTMGKCSAPKSLCEATEELRLFAKEVEKVPRPDLRKIPKWVRKFFHNETLLETLRWSRVLMVPGREFYFSCLLGILHHQRPGFLSYPSSHLVPYLRDKKYPKSQFPEMYEFREVGPRLQRKVERALKRQVTELSPTSHRFELSDIRALDIGCEIDGIITSPPYMNALDYLRDNRLRLYLAGYSGELNDGKLINSTEAFEGAIDGLFRLANKSLKKGGHCVVVIGERVKADWKKTKLPEKVIQSAARLATDLEIISLESDQIPDVRRSRRGNRGVKRELVLTFKRTR